LTLALALFRGLWLGLYVQRCSAGLDMRRRAQSRGSMSLTEGSEWPEPPKRGAGDFNA